MAILSKHSLVGKRQTARRREDRQKSYGVDRYSLKIFVTILLVISLSMLDATLTLFLISEGASELNPVMAYFLEHGPLVFFVAKYLMTSFALVFILPNTNSYLFGTKVRGKILFGLFAVPFALAVKWELYLIFFVL